MKNLFKKYDLKYLISASLALSSILAISDILTRIGSKVNEGNIFLNIAQIIFTDLGVGFAFILMALLPFLLGTMLHKKLGMLVVATLGLIVLLANLGLNKYFNISMVQLGSDLYGYTYDDILMIVSTSTDFNFLSYVPFMVFPIALFVLIEVLNSKKVNKVWFPIPMFGGLIGLLITHFLITGFQTNLSYFVSDSIDYKFNKTLVTNADWSETNAYPLMRPLNVKNDVLGEYLNLADKKPNIVLLVVEGLGSDFSGENAQYKGFTPFLDSLSKKSLFWSNFVSNTGRSFGALPSILGSAPFGENGFLELENLPAHLSLLSLMNQNGYQTSYFEGGDSNFDNKIKYLQNEGVDFVLDESNFGPGYKKSIDPKNGFSWGFPDSEIFRKTLTVLDKPVEKPRLDVILTISNHEPFNFPGKEDFKKNVELVKSKGNFSERQLSTIKEYEDIFASLMYTDTSIENFMKEYSKNENYENTIFIITGDHRLIPVPQRNAICRYHVPLIVFSPLQKKAQEFKGISSHMDITPSIMTMIKNKYDGLMPTEVPWLGSNLSQSIDFVNDHEIPLMKYKGAFKDFIANDYFLSDKKVFKINSSFGVNEINNEEEKSKITERYNYYKKVNAYVTQMDKIIPQDLAIIKTKKIVYTQKEQAVLDANIVEGETTEQIYFKARELAFNKKFEDALVLVHHINQTNPNHFDARTLKGRIYGWSGDFEKAESELLYVINRSPLYKDSYRAILDLYWWNDKPEEAKKVGFKLQENFADDKEFLTTMKEKVDRVKSEDLAMNSSN